MPIVRLGGDKEPTEEPKGPSRRELSGNWLKAYAEYTAESESPESFHLWTGLSVLASAVRRNVFLDQGFYILYPNLYVILTAPPGTVAKSTTIRLGRTILLSVPQIKFGADSITMEELVRQLEKAGSDSTSSALTLHSTELSDLIDPSGIKMISFLTSIYDGDIKWNRSTKGSGSDNIKNPVINLLGGTTPSWLATGMPVQAVDHGFTSRVIFVFEDKPRFLNPYPNAPDRELVRALINDLNYIALIKGEFQWDPGHGPQPEDEEGKLNWEPGYKGPSGFKPSTKSVYQWYYKQIANTRAADYRVAGYHARKRNHLLKVAMLLSIAEGDDLMLRPRDLDAAWAILEATEKRMARAFSAVGKNEHASDLERILAAINENGGMTEKDVYEENYAAGDVQQISRIIQMLVQMGKIRRVASGGEVWYRPVRPT